MPNSPEPDRSLVATPGKALGVRLATSIESQSVIQAPPPRSTWSDEIVDSYYAFWEDASARAARRVDLTMIFRYFDLNEVVARLYEELLDASLSIETNAGSIQTHPHIAAIARLTTTAIKLAGEIGATPMSRLKLGLTKLEGQIALESLEKKLGGEIRRQSAIPEDDRDDVLDAEVVHEW